MRAHVEEEPQTLQLNPTTAAFQPPIEAIVGHTGDDAFLYTQVHIEGIPCTALIDTGSSITIVHPDALQQAGTDWRE